MDAFRAQEIAQSPVMADVRYDGTPVYIQRVDEQKHTVRIFAIDDPDNELDVSLDSLEEY
ncbi:small acid-soluble spore protein H (minor) [Alteribacillus persepolensis]|uniref:Small, acid-soluble spore protein H n=1 Tax=Alteribacillus persepolensis TaxID=568899 RepID=A0A1G8C135_9BACI|nr:H-type small acid-soluble spore protein [Alteribacillus persepolensis]SDH39191.1 small acid-soluble spore protein H (minor) [Alteribacillus persepolensis]